MHKSSFFGVFAFVFIVFVIGPYVIVAQNSMTGEWTAKTKADKPDTIHISFVRRTENEGRNQHGATLAFADLQGLTREQARNGQVSFRLAREAGTIECEGSFTDGKGAGTYRFTPNYGFSDAMRTRGFDFAKPSKHGKVELEDRLFAATTLNVTTSFAGELRSANFGELTVDDLFAAVIFRITPQFMSEMKATGFPDLSFDDLIKARIFKIDADYVRNVREMGFDKGDFEGLVKFRIFKVTPEFLTELRTEGFADLSAEQVVKFKMFNIDSQFIRTARLEQPNITVEGLVQRRIGVHRR